ncbi:MAG: hypothetical protein HY721_11705 [Planctomycetes bacterium]|nr:hypothetical protein [Planctomycetota bacterium]
MPKHLDEARRAALAALSTLLEKDKRLERCLLIDDLFGRLRVVVWPGPREAPSPPALRQTVSDLLRQAAEPYWSGEVWIAGEGTETDRMVYESAWAEGHPEGAEARLRVTERHRNRGGWFKKLSEARWKAPGLDAGEGPPIVAFYSFKGGVGRSTALASFAIQRARKGERVVAVDLDLDAPGVGHLLAADEKGTTAPWGVVDYLLERPRGPVDLRDYYHACRRSQVTGPGEILVVPAGRMDPEYLGKLARVDFEPPSRPEGSPGEAEPVVQLLSDLRLELKPNWILLDARAGLADPAGMVLGGLAHLYVLFATASEQSWQGLRLVLERLGADRVRDEEPQIECLLVQAMVPENAEVAARARAAFSERARDEFAEHYFAEDPDDREEDRLWYVRDLDDQDAPHFPAVISYQPRLAHFRSLDDVADALASLPEYRVVAERIAGRFWTPRG